MSKIHLIHVHSLVEEIFKKITDEVKIDTSGRGLVILLISFHIRLLRSEMPRLLSKPHNSKIVQIRDPFPNQLHCHPPRVHQQTKRAAVAANYIK